MQVTLVTPSYRADLERAQWMRRSVQRFMEGRCEHLIVVPREDQVAFRTAFAADQDVRVLCQQDVVDRIFYPDLLYRFVSRLAPSQTWRIDLRGGLPGWMIQQIVKLNATRWAPQGALVLVDSDLVFTRPFTLADLGLGDEAPRTLVRITPPTEASRHRRALERSRRLLALPAGPSEHHYMSSPTIWYTDWVESLKRHLTAASGMDWQHALFYAQEFSEYTLYGLFVEEVLRPPGLRVRTQRFHRIVHDRASFDQLRRDAMSPAFFRADELALVVQSNIGVSVQDYREILERLIN